MSGDRAPVGLLVAALGAAVLAVSVFTPWYGVSITPAGAAEAQQQLATVAQEYGNPTFQAKLGSIDAAYTSLVGRQLFTISAHRALRRSWLLLLLATAALLGSLLQLANFRGAYLTGGKIALVGMGGILFVLAGTAMGPTMPPEVSLSLTWGIWLALLSAAAVFFGGLFAGSPRRRHLPRYEPPPRPQLPLPSGRDISSPLAIFHDKP